jgi:hypothetical protein
MLGIDLVRVGNAKLFKANHLLKETAIDIVFFI